MKRIGILGAGQLGRMLALAGIPLDMRFRFLDRSLEAPAACLGEIALWRDDQVLLQRFADGLSVLTYEFENFPCETVELLSQFAPVFPDAHCLRVAQDRLLEKQLFDSLAIPTTKYFPVESLDDLLGAVEQLGFPAVLKTRRMGYDGKGQRVVRDKEDAVRAWTMLAGSPLLLESFIAFDREISLLAVRGRSQSGHRIGFYPVVENHHGEGILRRSIAPAPDSEALAAEARSFAQRIIDRLEYVGVLAIEFFVKDGRLIANEMAPRVHNSGHWTIEGAETSQFENHLRAIVGLPLGSCQNRGHSLMYNLVGAVPPIEEMLAIPGAHVHLYGKEARPGRKIGHVTLCDVDATALRSRAEVLSRLIRDAR